MLLPAPLPDELFASVLARIGRLNGMADLREVTERCFGLEACPSFIDAKLNLLKFGKQFGDAYSEPDILLEQLTLLGVRKYSGEFDETVWSDLVLGNSSISIGNLTFLRAVELRFCRSCRKSDSERDGMAYWHRMHQFPMLYRCLIHGDRLQKAVIKRAALHQSFPLPNDFSDESIADLPALWNHCFEDELAIFFEMLLMQQRPPQVFVRTLLQEELWERGFLNSKGLLRTHELFAFLISRLCQGNGSEELSIVRQIVRNIHEPSRGLVFGRVLLLCAFFGNWRIVAERCKWLEALGTPVGCYIRDKHKLRQDILDVKEMHREKCLAYIANDLGCSRLGFTKQYYRSFRWLLHHDRSWLDQYLPVLEYDMEQLHLFSKKEASLR